MRSNFTGNKKRSMSVEIEREGEKLAASPGEQLSGAWTLIWETLTSLKPTPQERQRTGLPGVHVSREGLRVSPGLPFWRNMIHVESSVAQTSRFLGRLSSPQRGFICHIFVFDYLLPHCRSVWDLFLLNLSLISIQHSTVCLSPSAYNYHLPILISFQAAYTGAPTFMILSPYILIS